MINVNTNDLKKIIDDLNLLIDEYELIQLNIFNQLKDSVVYWQDSNSIIFEDKIYLDKTESKMFLELLKSKKELYQYIYDKYSELGKKIYCNLNNKNNVMYTIDDCYNKIVNIINDFNRIDTSFNYPEKYNIFTQKNNLIAVKSKLSEIKDSLNKTYLKIEEIEKEINARINKLQEIKINDFEFNFN